MGKIGMALFGQADDSACAGSSLPFFYGFVHFLNSCITFGAFSKLCPILEHIQIHLFFSQYFTFNKNLARTKLSHSMGFARIFTFFNKPLK